MISFSPISQALFNRLLLLEPGNHLFYMTSCSAVNLSADRDAGEKCAIPYLYACYQRAKEEVQTCMLSSILPSLSFKVANLFNTIVLICDYHKRRSEIATCAFLFNKSV